MLTKQLATTAVVTIAIAASMPAVLAQDQHHEHEGESPEVSPGLVRAVRQTTQKFQDVNAATAAGYVSTQNCASGPNLGAMGVHYVNETFISDGVLDVQRPEVLVYEPHGEQLQLVAVEFRNAKQWDAANDGQPVIGGKLLNYVGAPNRIRIPAHYELHVWACKRNTSGIFSDWNPHM